MIDSPALFDALRAAGVRLAVCSIANRRNLADCATLLGTGAIVDTMAQYEGTVRWFNNAKGYGFLGREGGDDVFVHYSSVEMDGYKSLKQGDIVEYDVVVGSTGKPQAAKVRILSRPDAA